MVSNIKLLMCLMYKPHFHKVSIKGTLSKNAIKMNNFNLLNHLNFYLTDKGTEKTFSVFSLTNLIVFFKYKKNNRTRDCNTLKKSWDRGKTILKRLQNNTPLEASTISSLTGEVIKIEYNILCQTS